MRISIRIRVKPENIRYITILIGALLFAGKQGKAQDEDRIIQAVYMTIKNRI